MTQLEPEDTPDSHDEERKNKGMDEEQENGNKPHSEEEASMEPPPNEEAWQEKFMHQEESDDPELEELMERLEDVTQSGNLEEMRNLHQELHARHEMGRQEAVRRVTNLI